MYFIASITVILPSTLAQSWLRRAYYDDTQCANILTVGISLPATYACSQTSPLTSSCIVKGQDPYKTGTLKSSEAAGCMVRDGPITDAVWVPTANEGKLAPGASYMVVNAYTDTSCASTALYEQDIFLADGKCHAVEFEKSFFRATCVNGVGTLSVFTDPLCQDCSGGDLNAGIYQVQSVSGNGACVVPNSGIAYKIVCAVPGGSGEGNPPASGNVCSASASSPATVASSVESTGTTTVAGSNIGSGQSSATTGSTKPSTIASGSIDVNSDQRKAASLIGMAGLIAMAA